MKKLVVLLSLVTLFILSACGGGKEATNEVDTNSAKEVKKEEQTITFGMTGWTSTEAPSQIAKLILEEAGYTVEMVRVDQPVIFAGLKEGDIDFFMDAWLPNTEAELWAKYEEDLQKVSASYENVPLGWVVPSYVEENSIDELKGKAEKYGNEVVTIAPGAGIVEISRKVLTEYELDEFNLVTSSEPAMMAEAKKKIANKEPIIITGWRPHSMFANYDLKFLEDPKGLFQYDNVYVISYKGIEEKYPEAYEILSKWSIEVADLEDMMLQYEVNEVPFEESAKAWIDEHRDQVDQMLGK